jgi:hypothetical protein
VSDPDPWQTNAAAPFLQIEGSEVAVWSLGDEQFRVTNSEALALAHELAELERRGLA